MNHQDTKGILPDTGAKMKTKTIRQQVTFKDTTPHELYEWLMDSKKHSQFTGQKAVINRKVGGKFKAGDGWIEGMNLELIQDKLILQGVATTTTGPRATTQPSGSRSRKQRAAPASTSSIRVFPWPPTRRSATAGASTTGNR
jgi:hypothetical protein